MVKGSTAIAVVFVMLGATAVGMFTSTDEKPVLEDKEGWGTVSYEVPTDGSTPLSHSGLENIGYMARRLQEQPEWYSEMGGVVNTVIRQEVSTYKQYSDGVLISTDISKSSMVNTAKQLCFVGDSVLWREAAKDSSEWNGVNTEWKMDDPVKVSVEDFKVNYGLPSTEFSVYILNEETITSWGEVIDNGDGTYTQNFVLNHETDKAPFYYRQQMLKTGGLSAWPEFSQINVSYTFDAGWQVLKSEISEAYGVTMGPINTTCTAAYTTVYEYGTERCRSTAYDDYFCNYENKPVTDVPVGNDPTAVGCLSSAFGSVLAGPTVFDVSVNLNGAPLSGSVYVDINNMDIRAQFGSLKVWFADNVVYLSYGNVKARMSVEELLALIADFLPASDAGAGIDTNELLGQLGKGTFIFGDGSASLSAKLSLMGFELPVEFAFLLDGDNNASLDYVSASVNMAGVSLDASLCFGQTGLPALTDEEKQAYIGLAPYVGSLINLFTAETLSADISYTYGDIRLNGKVDLSLKDKKASGALTVLYGQAKKTVTFGCVGGNVYLNLDGVKVCANANEAVALVTGFVNLPADGGFDLGALLTSVFTEDFAGSFAAIEEEGTLSVAIKGSELLSALGIEFGLGEVKLAVNEGALTANVLGAEISVMQGTAVVIDTEGYTDILPYANALTELFKEDNFVAVIAYAGDEFSVEGTVKIRKKDFAAIADIAVNVGGTEKNVSVLYAQDGIYFTLDGLKIKATVSEALSLVTELLGTGAGASGLNAALEKILSLNFGELITLQENGGLDVTVNGTQLLNALGVNFALGDVVLGVRAGELTADAVGVHVSVSAGEPFSARAEGYYADVTPVLKKLPAIMNAQAVSFGGLLDLTLGGAEISFDVKEGAVSWKDGIRVYLDASLCVLGTMHDITLYADKEGVSFAYGTVGAEISFERLPDLESAFVALYNRIKTVVDKIAETEESPMPAIGGMKDLLAQLGAGADLSAAFGSIDFDALFGKIELREPELQKGLIAIAFGGLYFELADETAENGFAGGVVRYKSDKFSLSGEVHLNAPVSGRQFPSMPDISYLSVTDFAEMFDYLGAAAELLVEKNLTFDVAGTVASSDAVKYPDGVKYDVAAKLGYYAGERFPAHLDLGNRNFYLDSEMYLHAEVDLAPRNAEDEGFFFEIYLLDANPDGSQDGTLDFYVTVSKFAKGAEAGDPLKIYAPADEIMTLVSAIAAALGVDNDFINDVLVAKWLDAETADQLRALGASLVDSTGLKGIFDKLFGGAGAQITGLFAAENGANGGSRKGFLKEIAVNSAEANGNLNIILNSSAVYGAEMPADITLSVSKETGADGSYIAGLTLSNIYGDKTAEEKTDIALTVSRTCDRTVPSFAGYTNAEGIDSLLKTIVNSATHVLKNEQGEIIYGEGGHRKYALNEQFYIDGEIKVSAGISATVKVRGLSVRVDKDNRISVDFGISYDKVTGIIKAKSELDLTMKDGMVYMKRVAEAKGAPEVIYRAMPAENFMSDILEQLIFIFNFDDLIAGPIRNSSGGGASSDGGVQDYGALLKAYLSSYSHGTNENGNEVWNITLNGAGISGGLLGGIEIGLAADQSNALRSLSVLTKLYSIVTIKGELAFRNPCNVWDKGVTDKTTDIHGVLEEGLGRALREADWSQTVCVEGELKELFFVVDGEDAGKQSVVVGKNGELYADVCYPDLSKFEEKQGYTLCWTKTIDEEAFVPNATAYASYVPNCYDITLESVRPLNGYTFDETRGIWIYTFPYTYGTELVLPAQSEDAEMRVAAFVDGKGNAVNGGEGILSDTVLTAVWEYIDYTVIYTADGQTLAVQNAHFGDEYIFPQAPEKQGYTFGGWSAFGTVTENATVSALYVPKTFNVTLKSENPAEGFIPSEGGYSAAFAYTYGQTVALPVGAEYGGCFLAAFTDADGKSYTEIKNILCDLVLTAKWEAIGYKVTFQADGVIVGTRNFLAGENISSRADLPAVPEKDGYSGEWNILTDTVSGDMTVEAVYTPNAYRVTLVSEYALAGYSAGEEGYVSAFDYVYGTAAVQLNASLKIPDFDFGGYYTQKGGNGDRVTEINCILSDTVLYLHWIDNTVSVKLYSDVAFDGADGKDAKGYYKSLSFNDDYTLDYTPVSAGYQTLGWWTEQNGAWSAVTDVKALGGAEIWALWIKDITVNVTEFYTNKFIGFLRYNIGGNYTGGTVYGLHSEKISAAIGLSAETTVLYQVIFADGNFDSLSGGSDYPVEGNAFKRTEMNCGNGAINAPEYGGAEIMRKFTANGKTVTTCGKNYISLASYKVIYLDEDGDQLLAIENVRGGYYRKTTLGMLGAPDLPVKRGYTGEWDLPADTVVNSDLTVHAVYTANLYTVTFTSERAIEGWDKENGLFVLRAQMTYGAPVSYYAGGTAFSNAAVSDGANVIALPEIPVWNGREADWKHYTVGENGAEFYAEYPLDSVAYSSEIAFTYNGAAYNTYRQQFEGDYKLITPVAEGFTFLGWYDKNNGWARVETLTPSGTACITEVEALWISDAQISVSGKRSYHISTKYDHTVNATLSGGVLVGAFAAEASVSVSYRYYLSNNTAYDPAETSNLLTNTYDQYTAADGFSYRVAKKSYGHAVATVTYTYGDVTFSTGELHGYVAY